MASSWSVQLAIVEQAAAVSATAFAAEHATALIVAAVAAAA